MNNQVRQMTIANLQELDQGKVALAINHALRQCVLDIESRPADKSRRKMQLVVDLTPILDKQTAALDMIGVEFTIQTKLPVRHSNVYPMLPSDAGILTFQPASPYDPRQQAFSYDQEKGKEQINIKTGEVMNAIRDIIDPGII
jgi:hypothetical protein